MTGDGDGGNGADLRAENARLVALLVSHGIEWRKPAEVDVPPAASALSTDQKVMPLHRLFVACLCAGWCRLCDGYAPVFDSVTAKLRIAWPGLQARWIDIEDEAALCGDLDIETFPTLLVCSAQGLLFAGPLEPHAATLERVLCTALASPQAVAGLPQQAAFETLAARLLGT